MVEIVIMPAFWHFHQFWSSKEMCLHVFLSNTYFTIVVEPLKSNNDVTDQFLEIYFYFFLIFKVCHIFISRHNGTNWHNWHNWHNWQKCQNYCARLDFVAHYHKNIKLMFETSYLILQSTWTQHWYIMSSSEKA